MTCRICKRTAVEVTDKDPVCDECQIDFVCILMAELVATYGRATPSTIDLFKRHAIALYKRTHQTKSEVTR